MSVSPAQTGSLAACSGSLMWSSPLSPVSERSPDGVELPLLGCCRWNHSKSRNTSGPCASNRQNRIYLIVSAGRVEGISSTDKQSIIVFLQKNFNKVVTLILKSNANSFVSSPSSTETHPHRLPRSADSKVKKEGGCAVPVKNSSCS